MTYILLKYPWTLKKTILTFNNTWGEFTTSPLNFTENWQKHSQPHRRPFQQTVVSPTPRRWHLVYCTCYSKTCSTSGSIDETHRRAASWMTGRHLGRRLALPSSVLLKYWGLSLGPLVGPTWIRTFTFPIQICSYMIYSPITWVSFRKKR